MTSPRRVVSAYSLSTLQTYVQRPSAVTKCFISDVHALRACIPNEVQGVSYHGRDVYMLDQWPCRNVELVAWVVGVDQKEKTTILTLDDGDGEYVLQVTVYLVLHTFGEVNARPTPSTPSGVSDVFASAKERKAARKAAAQVSLQAKKTVPIKAYLRKDVRVGDTVRVIGRINEWARGRQTGEKEWVREVVVDESSGGSISTIHEEEQYAHAALVQTLHQTLYSKPFIIPLLPDSLSFVPRTFDSTFSTLSSPSQTLSELPSSELSGYSLDPEELKLRDPNKLRTSQLTEATYRQYVLDYMTQETVRALSEHPSAIDTFPEYREYACGSSSQGIKHHPSAQTFPSRNASRDRTLHDKTNSYRSTEVYHRSSVEEETKSNRYDPYLTSTALLPFSIPDLLDVPQLHTLAHRIVEHTARTEEKRRLKRIRDDQARPNDLAIALKRKAEGRDWRLNDKERSSRMDRLTAYTIRGLSADGLVVNFQDGYLPLPPEMVLPLLAPHFERELFVRKGVFLRNGDPRKGNGALVADLTKRLNEWGRDGRWERVGEWVVEDAIRWGEGRGLCKREGTGWWLVEGAFATEQSAEENTGQS